MTSPVPSFRFHAGRRSSRETQPFQQLECVLHGEQAGLVGKSGSASPRYRRAAQAKLLFYLRFAGCPNYVAQISYPPAARRRPGAAKLDDLRGDRSAFGAAALKPLRAAALPAATRAAGPSQAKRRFREMRTGHLEHIGRRKLHFGSAIMQPPRSAQSA